MRQSVHIRLYARSYVAGHVYAYKARAVEESMTCQEHIWQSGRSEVAAVYGNSTIEVQKQITRPGKGAVTVAVAKDGWEHA